MQPLMEDLMNALDAVNGIIWHQYVLFIVLGVGVLFTFWSGFSQYRALTHGVAVTRGKYDNPDDPGAISHFQALSAALSATVGLGNIAGVGVAVALGGPGAVFWMWMVGIFGMAIKTTEVTLSMLYRNTDDPDNPHGGPMYVARQAFKDWGMPGVGKVVGGIFVVTLLISTITGGNMFQSWSVGEITENYFQVPSIVSGIILSVLVAMVIIGGIKRIGLVAGRIVPFMCAVYLIAAVVVMIMNFSALPGVFKMIFVGAFSPTEAGGAFMGGTVGYALLWGMKRALFSSECGQGSSPIAHSAAKTNEPVREAVVAGLEPFIDTLVVCSLTAFVILSTGAYNRGHEAKFDEGSPIAVVAVDKDGDGQQDLNSSDVPLWTLSTPSVPVRLPDARETSGPWIGGEDVFMVVHAGDDSNTGHDLHRINGNIRLDEEGNPTVIEWTGKNKQFASATKPQLAESGTELYVDYPGPSLTGHAFDRAIPGLGKYLVTFAAWLFALSTMISWSYYGEQGVVFLFGQKFIVPYKLFYCAMIVVAAAGFIQTDKQLDSITALGTGVMLWANIPIMLIFGAIAMRAYHKYIGKLKAGEFDQK